MVNFPNEIINLLLLDEREDVQKKTQTKWINSMLSKSKVPVTGVQDLFMDLRDGTRLLSLLEVLTGKTYVRDADYFYNYT